MYIAQQLKEKNIAEYLLYMWQVEDILRAHHLDPDELKQNYLAQFRATEETEKEMEEWYSHLIRMMKEEGIQEGGHLQINRNIILWLTDLHNQLLQSSKFPFYTAAYYKALPYIVELRNKGDKKDVSELENCFDALYGVMLLRLQHKPISDETAKAVADTVAEFGRIDVLVNNAGITRDTLVMRMKDDAWNDVVETDLTAAFRLARACVRPMMKQRSGRIISITSVVGAMGNAGQVNYAAAKAGLMGMTKALAREIGSRGITVNCVAPGFIDTDMTAGLPEEHKAALLAQIPLGRLGGAQEIADACLFLASDAGAYVTGTTLHVNGGMFMG